MERITTEFWRKNWRICRSCFPSVSYTHLVAGRDGGAYFGKVYKDDIGEFGLGMV